MHLKDRWTGLRTTSIMDFIKNVKYFKQTLDGLTKEETPKFFELGTQVHMYLLEPDEFKNKYTFLDYIKPRGDNQNKYCEYIANNIKKDSKINKKELCIEAYKKSYKVNNKSEDKITEEAIKLYDSLQGYIQFLVISKGEKEILSFNTLNYLKAVKQSVKKHKLATKLLFENEFSTEDHYNEQFILWEFPEARIHNNDIVIKSTVDKLIIDHDNKIIKLVDLKTTNDLSEFSNRFEEHNNYKVQLACYWKAVEKFFNDKFKDKNINEYNRETYLVALQTPNPYKDFPVNCRVWPISDESINKGTEIIKKVLPDIAWHFENDLWDHNRTYYEGDGSEKML